MAAGSHMWCLLRSWAASSEGSWRTKAKLEWILFHTAAVWAVGCPSAMLCPPGLATSSSDRGSSTLCSGLDTVMSASLALITAGAVGWQMAVCLAAELHWAGRAVGPAVLGERQPGFTGSDKVCVCVTRQLMWINIFPHAYRSDQEGLDVESILSCQQKIKLRSQVETHWAGAG